MFSFNWFENEIEKAYHDNRTVWDKDVDRIIETIRHKLHIEKAMLSATTL